MEKIKIAVVGEGPTDYGKWEYSERKKCHCWKEGPIFPIIRNTVDSFQEMIECWLLADESAFKNAFDLPSVSLPPHPELIWGDHRNPNSNYPKRYLERVLCSKEGRRIDSNLENYHLLAEHISIKTLCDRCRISFQCFYNDFNRVMETVSVLSAEPEQ